MPFKRSATLQPWLCNKNSVWDRGTAVLSQKCLREPRIASLRFFFSLSETLIMWLNADWFFFQFSESSQKGIISFLLSMRKTFQNTYLIENPVFHQNNFVCTLLISLAQNHKLSYFPCSRRGLRQYLHLQRHNCAGKRSQTFLPSSPFLPLFYVLAIQGTENLFAVVVCVY